MLTTGKCRRAKKLKKIKEILKKKKKRLPLKDAGYCDNSPTANILWRFCWPLIYDGWRSLLVTGGYYDRHSSLLFFYFYFFGTVTIYCYIVADYNHHWNRRCIVLGWLFDRRFDWSLVNILVAICGVQWQSLTVAIAKICYSDIFDERHFLCSLSFWMRSNLFLFSFFFLLTPSFVVSIKLCDHFWMFSPKCFISSGNLDVIVVLLGTICRYICCWFWGMLSFNYVIVMVSFGKIKWNFTSKCCLVAANCSCFSLHCVEGEKGKKEKKFYYN